MSNTQNKALLEILDDEEINEAIKFKKIVKKELNVINKEVVEYFDNLDEILTENKYNDSYFKKMNGLINDLYINKSVVYDSVKLTSNNKSMYIDLNGIHKEIKQIYNRFKNDNITIKNTCKQYVQWYYNLFITKYY